MVCSKIAIIFDETVTVGTFTIQVFQFMKCHLYICQI